MSDSRCFRFFCFFCFCCFKKKTKTKVGKKVYKHGKDSRIQKDRREDEVNANKPKDVCKATETNQAQKEVSSFKESTINAQTEVAASETARTTKTKVSDPFGQPAFESTINAHTEVAASETARTTKTKDSDPFGPPASPLAFLKKGTGLYAYSGASQIETSDSSDSEVEEISVSYGKPAGDPTSDIKRFKNITKSHFGENKYTEKRIKVGKKGFKNKRTDNYYYSGKDSRTQTHTFKEKGVDVNKPKNVTKAMKPTKMEMAEGALGIWSSVNDKLADQGVSGFKELTFNAHTEVAASETAITTKTNDSDAFGPSASAVASTGKAGASCGASGTGLYAYAGAKASGAEASAKAALVDGIIETGVQAEAASAQGSVNVSPLGVHAGAGVKLASASVGISNTPLQAGVSVLSAGAETGVGYGYTGASAGAHFAEARAGPFGIRAGLKFGGGIRYGIPEVDAGPVTTPVCSVM